MTFIRAHVDAHPNGHVIYLNPAHIVSVEKNRRTDDGYPETIIHTTDGIRYYHHDPLDKVLELVR